MFMLGNHKGVAGNLVTVFIGLMIMIVVLVSVVLPTITDAVEEANITGPAATLLGILPLLLVVVVVVVVVALIQ